MTPAQQSALEGLAQRPLAAEELSAIEPHLAPDARNDVAIAGVLSAGRTQLQSRYIGVGTVLSVMAPHGGAFMDALVALGEVDRNIFWAMDLLRLGRLDIGDAVTQAQVAGLAVAHPDFAAGLNGLLAMGRVSNPVGVGAVSDALNVAEGRLTL